MAVTDSDRYLSRYLRKGSGVRHATTRRRGVVLLVEERTGTAIVAWERTPNDDVATLQTNEQAVDLEIVS